MYIFIFAVTFIILVLVQLGIDRMSFSRIGKCEMEVKSTVEKMDLLTQFFRTSLCFLIAGYYIYKTGNEFSYHIMIFTAIMGALASKIFFPVITISCFSDACGIYENGIVTMCGTKYFKNVKSFSVHVRSDAAIADKKMMLVFQSRFPYVSRPSYFYISKKNYNRAEKLLAIKYHVSKVQA